MAQIKRCLLRSVLRLRIIGKSWFRCVKKLKFLRLWGGLNGTFINFIRSRPKLFLVQILLLQIFEHFEDVALRSLVEVKLLLHFPAIST